MTEIRQENNDRAATRNPQQERRKKTLLATLILLVPFIACMYFIVGGGKKSETSEQGINVTIPDGRNYGIEASKQKALERVSLQEGSEQRTLTPQEPFSLMVTPRQEAKTEVQENPVAQAQKAHAEAARAMSGFYSAPRTDPQVAELKRQITELQDQLDEQRMQTPDPLEMAEKQYALAAKYFPQNSSAGVPAKAASASAHKSTMPVQKVRALEQGVVSSLSSMPTDSAAWKLRNTGFNTAVGTAPQVQTAGIHACVDEDQTLQNGDRVRLRLSEAVQAGNYTLGAGTVLFGTASILGQRLQIAVSGIEHKGEIIPVSLHAYDLDGAEGLYIPDSQERTSAQEAAAGIGSSLGSGISFSQSAGQQVAMDLTRGLLAGGSQYLSSKLRQVRVSVKAGYRVLLLTKE